MTLGRKGREVTVLAILSVLTIFLFPSVQGPYSVMHGPATAFQAARASARLRTAIAQSALNSIGNPAISPLIVLSWMSLPDVDFPSAGLPELNDVLRC